MSLLKAGSPLNIANGIRRFGRATPRNIAVIDNRKKLTYAALDDRSTRVANLLLSSGMELGSRIAVLLSNRLEYPELMAGIAKAGMVSVPLDPRNTAFENGFIVGRSSCQAIFFDDALADGVATVIEDHKVKLALSLSGNRIAPDYEDALEESSGRDPQILIDETEPFTIAYTSGTTGDPKGVMISHRSRSLTFYCAAIEWGLGPNRCTVAVAPMCHGAGFAFSFAAIYCGGTVSMMQSFDPEHFLFTIEKDRVESAFLVPTHAKYLRALSEPTLATFDLSSLKILYFNAAPFPQDMKFWTLDTFPGIDLHELYGSTEAGVVTNLRPEDQRRKTDCVGPPWFMTEICLLDTEDQPVPPGEVGELYSRSPFLMSGYFENPSATASITTHDGFLSAGDLATIDDEGFVYITGRKKDMIITGGLNVFPQEIERVLITHDDVEDAAVIGCPSDEWGEQVVAVVVPSTGVDIRDEILDQHCRRSLAGYKVPRSYVVVEELPKNASGKILKEKLRAKYKY